MEVQLANTQAMQENLERQLTGQRKSLNQQSGETPGKSVANLLLTAPTIGLAEENDALLEASARIGAQ